MLGGKVLKSKLNLTENEVTDKCNLKFELYFSNIVKDLHNFFDSFDQFLSRCMQENSTNSSSDIHLLTCLTSTYCNNTNKSKSDMN